MFSYFFLLAAIVFQATPLSSPMALLVKGIEEKQVF